MSVTVVDAGLGNLASVMGALEALGVNGRIAEDPGNIDVARAIILPGVGSFAEASARMEVAGWASALQQRAEAGGAILGICLGMQLLASEGDEDGGARGLGVIPGRVRRMEPAAGERIPHMGWNEVHPAGANPLLEGVPEGADFYFLHSYAFEVAEAADQWATTPFAGGVAAVVGRGSVMGVQFHPEKSSRHGLRVLGNFLRGAGVC